MKKRRFAALLMALVLAATASTPGDLGFTSKAKATEVGVEVDASQVNAVNAYGLMNNIQDGTILHCFDWKYSDIKAELPNIAKAGFTSIQTSPAQKGEGTTWYWLYQPQTFSIQPNALGDKAQLTELCAEAEKYGIKIVVDVVANHLRSIGDDGLGDDCFHHDGDAWYSDRYGVTHGKIGMPDLNSESSTVQNKVKGYIEELKSVGVDGIRWDAAKHISLPSEDCQFWPVVTNVGLYNYGEILESPCDGSSDSDKVRLMKEYTNYMTVTDDNYGDNCLNACKNGGVPTSIGNYSERGLSKNKLIYWAESHDTYSNNGEYGKATQFVDENSIDRAYALLAAQANATCLYFSRPFEKDKQRIMAGVKGSTHFADKEVAAVNHFHNAMNGQKEYYVQNNGVAAVCREKGAVIVKKGGGNVSISNGGKTVAPGTYKDEITGNTFTVTGDQISGNVGDKGIAVVYDYEGYISSWGGEVADGGSTGGDGDVVTAKPVETPVATSSTKGTANTVVAKLPSGWSKLNIYAYSGAGENTKTITAKWPGTEMKKNADGTYSYTFDSSVSAAKVIFNDGAKQDPANVEGKDCGYDYVGGKAYSYEDGSWKELQVTADEQKATVAPTTKAPATKAPATKAPATVAPTTKAPATKAPATKAPATKAPTAVPTTKAPTPTPTDLDTGDNPSGSNSYKITYVLNDGYFVAESVPTSYTAGYGVELLKPVRQGYKFGGWYLDSNYTTKITRISADMSGDVVVYAKWSKVSKPGVPTIQKVTKKVAAKTATIKLKAKVSGASGYQYVIARNAVFTKNRKSYTTSASSKTIKKLIKGKKYYVKVRAYKKDSTGKKYYGAYTKVLKFTFR